MFSKFESHNHVWSFKIIPCLCDYFCFGLCGPEISIKSLKKKLKTYLFTTPVKPNNCKYICGVFSHINYRFSSLRYSYDDMWLMSCLLLQACPSTHWLMCLRMALIWMHSEALHACDRPFDWSWRMQLWACKRRTSWLCISRRLSALTEDGSSASVVDMAGETGHYDTTKHRMILDQVNMIKSHTHTTFKSFKHWMILI